MSISITNEILLTKGEAFTPRSIISTPDDQMIVTGSWGGDNPGIAIKLNKSGEISWTYRWKKKTLAAEFTYPYLVGASVLSNGDVLLCGNDAIGDAAEPRNPRKTTYKSQFIKLKADGTLVDEISFSPKSDYDLFYPKIQKCGRWGAGSYAFGDTFRVKDADRHESEHFLWIVKTDSQGKIVWEKLIPTNVVLYDFSTPQLLPNGNLLFAATGNGKRFENGRNRTTELVVMSPDGTIKAQRQLVESLILVKRLTPDQPIIAAQLSGNHLWYLDESLATIKEQKIDESVSTGLVNYLYGENNLVTFSWTHRGSMAIGVVSQVNLSNGKVVQIEPAQNQDGYHIQDAVALDSHGTFAFVNQTTPSNESAIGVTLIQLK